MASTALRRAVVFGGPAALAILAALHPPQVGERMDAWFVIHVLQIPLVALLGGAVVLLLDGIPGRTATVARFAVLPWVAAFAAFDALAGLAEGTLADYASDHPDQSEAVDGISTAMAGALYMELVSGLAIASAIVAFGGAGLALQRSGASMVGTILIAAGGVVWTVIHPLIGAVGMLAFFFGAWMVERPKAAGVAG